MTDRIRIAVIDDHRLFRAGLVEVLGTVPGFVVEAEGSSGEEAATIARDVTPDVVILDVGMPGPDPTVTVARIREHSPSTAVVVVTMFDDSRLIHELIKAGAASYLLKSAHPTELATAIRAAVRSDDVVTVSVTRQAFLGMTRVVSDNQRVLSPREISVLRLIGESKNNRDISSALNISEATVKRHLNTIYAKLGATSRVDAVLAARRSGLIADR